MKRITVIVSLFMYVTGWGQAKGDKGIIISHLAGDFYVYITHKDYNGTMFPSNSLYAVTKEGVVMIDTPWDTTQFQPLLDSIRARHNKDVVLCISTHYHADRTAGLEFLRQKGVKTYTSKQTFDLCATHNEKQSEFYFTKDTVFRVGGLPIQTYYPGEGHTRDNIVVWFDKEKILYGGCFVKSPDSTGLGNIADANLQQWPVSAQRTIKKFPRPKYVIPGHFGWSSNKGLQHTYNLLKQNENRNR